MGVQFFEEESGRYPKRIKEKNGNRSIRSVYIYPRCDYVRVGGQWGIVYRLKPPVGSVGGRECG